MNHHRVHVFRDALANLLESLDALVLVTSSNGAEQPAAPANGAASQLQVRLASAVRLAAGKFTGTLAESPTVTSICGKIKRLETAYVTYCRRLRASESPESALQGLTNAIEDVRKGVA